jgi:hypothetical protein
MINQIKESHQKDTEEIIQDIEKKNCSEFDRLTKDNLAKDEKIKNLQEKEGQLEGKEE